MTELSGWLLDVYTGEQGLTVWLLGEDGERHCLRQAFPVTFYVSSQAAQKTNGHLPDLRAAWRWLAAQPEPIHLARVERRDLFTGPMPVLAIEVQRPGDLPGLFRRCAEAFPALTFYDADLPISLRYAAVHGVFALCHCRVELQGDQIKAIAPLDSPWDIDPEYPSLRVLGLEPDCNPAHAAPQGIIYSYKGYRYRQPLEPARALLANLNAVLRTFDPDLILTTWGDTWLLPKLLELSKDNPLLLNRDPAGDITRKAQRTYYAYGQVIYRGAQVHLAGRWHIDTCNAVMYHDYGLDGIFELARVTGLPVQTVARVSPGTGISSMQIVTALRQGILVPWHKQQAEAPKNLLELVHADMGGMIYQPTVGLHRDVAEVDFVSMYPSVMAHFNISPETILPGKYDPLSGLPLTRAERGLVPETLQPLLQKRIAIKSQLLVLPKWDARRKRYKAAASAHKWLLVTCFGYLGYKNARFGRIESHEAVTAYGRETLLRAKEAAEDLGFEVLHLYVDGMWIKKPGSVRAADFQPLLDEILTRTGLPIALDGIYRWVAFLPSRQDVRIPVANRYFGVFQSGEIKVRGIELRRRDTPDLIKELQQGMLDILAKAPDVDHVPELLPEVQALVCRRLADLRGGRVAPEKLVVRQTLSRELEAYRSPSPAAVAAQQLAKHAKDLRPGQVVRFLYTLGKPGVRAWDVPGELDRRTIDVARYTTLLERAAETIFQPFRSDAIETRLPLLSDLFSLNRTPVL
ncbi:MAG: DNA polymerase domain-containing protein [Anaerolineales bacterium]